METNANVGGGHSQGSHAHKNAGKNQAAGQKNFSGTSSSNKNAGFTAEESMNGDDTKQVTKNSRSDMVEKVYGAAHDKAHEVAEQAVNRLANARDAVATQLETASETIRSKIPEEGRFGAVAQSVASSLDTAGLYLKTTDLPVMGRDIVKIAKRYPLQSIAVGIGLGILVGRTFKRSI